MGMPITAEVLDGDASAALGDTFAYFRAIDERFSTYKDASEIMRINRGEIPETAWSAEMREVFALAEKTKYETRGYFDIRRPDGLIDPSGVVKGWAIYKAAQHLNQGGHRNFFIDAGGDVATSGTNANGEPWSVGIRNPFDQTQIVKVVYPRGTGVATSGTYIRGKHIYDPHTGLPPQGKTEKSDFSVLVSLTVLGPDVLQADLFATAAFAMGANGIGFIEQQPGLEGYAIDEYGEATLTSGFERYTIMP